MYGDLCGVIPERNSALKPQENADFRQVCLFDLVIPEYPDKTRTHARCMYVINLVFMTSSLYCPVIVSSIMQIP